MKLEVLRFSSQNDSTLGILSDVTLGRKFLCFTLEDEFRAKKVYAETRIPAGTYRMKLRRYAGFHRKYSARFPAIHRGMLEILDVHNFTDILIHCGNTDDHTAGCLLVANTSSENISKPGFIGRSKDAYERIYPPIAAAIERDKEVTIRYRDFDTVHKT